MNRVVVIGIIFLFIASSVIPISGLNLKQPTIQTSSGNILYVGGNGTGNYSKIQDAIDNASDGDTVFVYAYSSPYYENVVVNKSINLIGEDKYTTIIDGQNIKGYDAVFVTASSVNINGFTMQHSGTAYYDAGLECYQSDNNIITDNIMTLNGGEDGGHGLLIYDSCGNIISENIMVENGNPGLTVMHHSHYNNISNNFISSNKYSIMLAYSLYNIIENNQIINSRMGIWAQSSQYTTIYDNNISGNAGGGIDLYLCSLNNIYGNTIVGNNGRGVMLRVNSICNVVKENVIKGNQDAGIYISRDDSCDNLIIENHIEGNYGKGIIIEPYYPGSVMNNMIYHNNFINNTDNGYDKGVNIWNDSYPSGGNYWDDYNGIDDDGDGIGDTPYNIHGGSNQDRYPLMRPYLVTVYVDDDFNSSTPGWGFDHFDKIQDGIDAVAKNGTVYVYNGTYYKSVKVNKPITLIGEDRDSTIIDGSGSGDVVYISADWVNISGFKIQYGFCGISFDLFCSNSSVFMNTVIHNIGSGIKLYFNSNNNIIFHNNFINNTQNAYDKCNNTWDNGYPSGGNYWDDYTGNDTNGDGIGDTPYNIAGGDNQDLYPFMYPNGWIKPPYEPSNPYPEDGARYVPVYAVLNWTGGDPNPGDIVTYDVYFGVTNPPTKKSSNQTGNSYDPVGDMELFKKYYWYIVSWDSQGLSTSGQIWHFTTDPPPLPEVEIVNPREGYFHFSGIPLFQTVLNLLADTVSFGGFRLRSILINATDEVDNSEDLIVKVYLNGEEQGNASYRCDWKLHEWFWTGRALGTYQLKVTAENAFGLKRSAEMKVWNFCSIP